MISKLIVKTAYANVYDEPSFTSQMISQALFFEQLNVISEHDSWYRVSQWDGYSGYIHKFYLSDFFEKNDENYNKLLISDRSIDLYRTKDFKEVGMVAPFGSEILVEESNDIFKILMIDNENYYFKHHQNILNKNTRTQIINNGKKLLGSPYLWGGKTPFGYDCSGFVQSVYKSVGISIKRDTSLQIKEQKMKDINLDQVKKGDLIFFNISGNHVDHVGIWFGDNRVIHCSGEVKIESINDTNAIKLKDYIVKVKSISEIANETN